MARSFGFFQISAFLFLLSFSNYCSALSLPLNITSSIINAIATNLTEPNPHPDWFDIPNAPGFSIHFIGYGRQLKPADCNDALITARWWLWREHDGAVDHPMGLEESQTFAIGDVEFELTVTDTLTYGAASLFIAGLTTWASMYGFSEVKEILFINQNYPPLATASFEATGRGLRASQSNQTLDAITLSSYLNATTLDNDPFLYPIVSRPGYYIRFMTYNTLLPADDARQALDNAHETIYKAYQQQISIFQKPRTFSYGQVSFVIQASGEMTPLDATTFIMGTQQLGAEKAYVESRAIFLKTPANLKGTMVYCGTGRLTKRVR